MIRPCARSRWKWVKTDQLLERLPLESHHLSMESGPKLPLKTSSNLPYLRSLLAGLTVCHKMGKMPISVND